MRRAILGRWIQDPNRTSPRVLEWASVRVSQVLIESFVDSQDPTVLRVERALAASGHKETHARSPTSIMANIRVRFQNADSVDIDTTVISASFYPEENKISGNTRGGQVKGPISFRLVAPDRLLVKGFPYIRIKNPASR